MGGGFSSLVRGVVRGGEKGFRERTKTKTKKEEKRTSYNDIETVLVRRAHAVRHCEIDGERARRSRRHSFSCCKYAAPVGVRAWVFSGAVSSYSKKHQSINTDSLWRCLFFLLPRRSNRTARGGEWGERRQQQQQQTTY